MAPHGFTAHVDQFDLREGGQYRMFFTNFSTGMQHSFHGTYHEIIENSLLRYTDEFDVPELAGKIEVRVEFKRSICRYRGSYYAVWFTRCDSCRWLLSGLARVVATLGFFSESRHSR